jgi:hypothetical protein
MSAPINNGGPAFPAQFFDERATGMTLRDYFAAKAMNEMTWTDHGWDAAECYKIADAMLRAREAA